MNDHDEDPLGQLQFDAFGHLVDLDEMELEHYPAPTPSAGCLSTTSPTSRGCVSRRTAGGVLATS